LSKNNSFERKEAEAAKDISLIRAVNQEKISLDTLKNIFNHLKERYNISEQDVLGIISDKKKYISFPVSIFCKELSPLEGVVKFLKENHKHSISEISQILQRDQTTIWITYSHATKKLKGELKPEDTQFWIPFSVLRERALSVLELVSEYLKEKYALSYHEIALALKRDDRTIWTVYQRAKKKRQYEKKKE
jgi:hypothetical protein